MKRLIKIERQPRYAIIVEVGFQSDISSADVPRYLTHVPGCELTPEQEAAYNDLIYNIMQIILHNGFEILQHYQSKKSYSYYIHVRPEFFEGIDAEVIEVKFRVADHPLKQIPRTTPSGRTPIIRTLLINDNICKDARDLLNTVRNICKDLRSGDYSSVLEI